MNIKLYSIAAIFLQQLTLYSLNKNKTALTWNIEVVKITKVLPKSQNKQKLRNQTIWFTESRCRKIPEFIPEINGIKKAGNYATDPSFERVSNMSSWILLLTERFIP